MLGRTAVAVSASGSRSHMRTASVSVRPARASIVRQALAYVAWHAGIGAGEGGRRERHARGGDGAARLVGAAVERCSEIQGEIVNSARKRMHDPGLDHAPVAWQTMKALPWIT